MKHTEAEEAILIAALEAYTEDIIWAAAASAIDEDAREDAAASLLVAAKLLIDLTGGDASRVETYALTAQAIAEGNFAALVEGIEVDLAVEDAALSDEERESIEYLREQAGGDQ